MVASAAFLNIEPHAEIPYGTFVEPWLWSVVIINLVLLSRVAEPTLDLEITGARTPERQPLDGVSEASRSRLLGVGSRDRTSGEFQTVCA